MSNIETKTAEFVNIQAAVKMMRAFEVGDNALKNGDFIRTPNEWDKDEKQFLYDMAVLLNATAKTAQGFSGMVTIKPPTLDTSPSINDIASNLIAKGVGIVDVANTCADELLSVGNIGLLVDYPRSNPDLTLAEMQAQNIKPYVVTYPIENIIECKVELINGSNVLTLVRLLEFVIVKDDAWTYKTEKRVRVLRLENGIYYQELYQINAKTGAESIIDGGGQVLANGATMNEIPFILVNAANNFNAPSLPPLRDLASMNAAHLNNSAWYERALWFCGSPMFWTAGYASETTPRIGSDTILMMADANAKLGIAQAGSDAVGAIKTAMDTKERNMAVIGARFLQGETTANIAENTATIHRSGDNATLSTISLAIEGALTKVLNYIGLFIGDNYKNKVTLTRDYLPRRLTAQELTALMQSWQGGAISIYDLYDNLVSGGIVQPRAGGAEVWQEELETQAPDSPNGVNV